MSRRFDVAFHTAGGGFAVADGRSLDIEIHEGDVVAATAHGVVFRAPIASVVTIEVRRMPRWQPSLYRFLDRRGWN